MSVKAARAGGDSARPGGRRFDLLAPEYEYLDPNPDLLALFREYNAMFFDGKLAGCEVKWSPRMTLCAGLCSFQPRSGFCSIRLSEPLLKLRPRSDMVNTLLHEMIHAFVFVSSPVKDHDDHGPVFQSHMHRINQDAGTKITVFHTFHDEVDAYRQHWWQCDGPCRQQKPYFGLVKRAMNRPPGPTDRWWSEHQQKCGGTYKKIKEPPEFTRKQEAKRLREEKKRARESPSVEGFFSVGSTKEDSTSKHTNKQEKPGASGKKKAKKKLQEQDTKPKSGVKSGEEKPRAQGDISSVPSGDLSSFFPVVVATGANGEEELLLIGGMDVVLGGRFPSVWQDPGAFTRPPSASSSGGVVDLTVSESDSEEDKPRFPTADPPGAKGALSSSLPGRSVSSQASTTPDVIEID